MTSPHLETPRRSDDLLGSDSLLESGRVSRRPLVDWARSLLQQLSGRDLRSPEHWPRVAQVMNNAALIEVARGDLPSGAELCALQLRWLHRCAQAEGLERAAALAPQPWINLGRLLRIQGRGSAALPHFALLRSAQSLQPISLGPVHLDASVWEPLRRDASLMNVLEHVYVLDSVKCFFKERDASGALEFLHDARERAPRAALSCDEAELLALARLGRPAEALRVTERASWRETPAHTLVMLCYRLALLALHAPPAPVKRSLRALVDRITPDLQSDERCDPRTIRLLDRLARVACHVDDPSTAERLWRTSFTLAEHIQDVPLQLDALDGLLHVAPVEQRGPWDAHRRALLRSCLYVDVLRRRGSKVDASLARAPVFSILVDSLHRVASGLDASCPKRALAS